MESGSVLSEPSVGNRGFAAERSVSMTVLSPTNGKPRMAHLETLEAKMASIEVSLASSTNTPRRRKGTSLGGASTISARASPRPSMAAADSISLHSNSNLINSNNQKTEHRSALQEREAIIQNLRMQLGLGKLPRPTGTPLDESERPAAEQRLLRLRNDADNKRVAIRNLKTALDKLDISDNIDVRIRQAELEYALGREELQLLSLVEEIRALQSRLEKSRASANGTTANSLFTLLHSGANLSLHAIQVTVGRFAVSMKPDAPGLYVEWGLDGEQLFRGDRIIEANGKILSAANTKEELAKIIGDSGRCDIVVIRKRPAPQHQQLLIQSQEDNQRLQHRISYLEDQVKELQETSKEKVPPPMTNGHHNDTAQPTKNGHVTSINISSASSPSTPPSDSEKPQIYQRGNFITTIIGGRPVTSPPPPSPSKTPSQNHITKTIIKEMNGGGGGGGHRYDSDHHEMQYYQNQKNMLHHSQSHHHIGGTSNGKLYGSASKISIGNDETYAQAAMSARREREKHYREPKENRRREEMDRHSSHPNLLNDGGIGSHTNGNGIGYGSHNRGSEDHNHRNSHNKAPSHQSSAFESDYEPTTIYSNGDKYVEHTQRISSLSSKSHRHPPDMRSVKSLDFDKDHSKMVNGNGTKHSSRSSSLYRKQLEVDYTSEPVATPLSSVSRPRNGMRPTPPKKPLRLSLQRAQSLQTIEASATAAILDLEKKRAIKRTHRGSKTPDLPHFMENTISSSGINAAYSSQPHLQQTSSLGRGKHV